MRRAALAGLLLLACVPAGAGTVERRCGWFHNPTPANYYLQDAAGYWWIARMGWEEPDGWDRIGNYAAAGWVDNGSGSYGYGCGCLRMEVARRQRRVLRILAAEWRPIARCRRDPNLPRPRA